ncbi:MULTISPECIES: S1 RNA-binding domain-containing protein [Thiorhodovibrio]|uniref:S1 RNA-binding domain-containing protein n=1 Tax=Thiorhodovibrio TaxID=61593 RepID=UPI001913EEB3|nr:MULTISPECIES: S1 RNA-binding domain-containing protein [Thiorhodovibrio]MBK5968406.1 hypothetical protein [Thiorhodovibrio winogradskyi]WPL11046.1 30S ribosomal protein S1 [Thiorhodovibrio litoralis]
MSDEFLELFGGVTEEEDSDDEKGENASAHSASTLEPTIARVLTSLEEQCVVLLPDGRETLIDQNVFDSVEPDHFVAIFPLTGGGWSLINPRWNLPEQPTDSAEPARGETVSLRISRYDQKHDTLLGQFTYKEKMQDGVVHRSGLPWPASFLQVDLNPFIGQSLALKVSDPQSSPVVLCAHVEPLPRGMSAARLYSLRSLASARPDIKVRVATTDTDKWTVDLFGWFPQVFPEDRGWSSIKTPLSGEVLDARLSVDMTTADVFICLRSPTHPEWQQVKKQYPLGMIICEARTLSMTNRGMMVEIGSGHQRTVGLLLWYQYAPFLGSYKDTYKRVPIPLQVIGYNDDRCVVLLGLEAYISLKWMKAIPEVGKRIPIHISSWNQLPSVCLWELGCQGLFNDTPKQYGWIWGRVTESDANLKTLKVTTEGRLRRTRLSFSGEHDFPNEVTLDDGNCACTSQIVADKSHVVDRETILRGTVATPRGLLPLIKVLTKEAEVFFATLQYRFENDMPITVRVTSVVKGGWKAEILIDDVPRGKQLKLVDLDQITAFLPCSRSDQFWRTRRNELINEVFPARIIKLDLDRRNIVISQDILQPSELKAELDNICEDDVLTGTVKVIVDYGAFVSIGNITGLLHQNEISYSRIKGRTDIEAILKTGQKIKVQVLSVDREKAQVSLSIKQLRIDPLAEFAKEFPAGSILNGKVKNINDFGVFIELCNEVEGLLHVSEMTWLKQPPHPKNLFQIGANVRITIKDFDIERRRIGLSRKNLLRNPWLCLADRYPPGSFATGRISSVCDAGFFVTLSPGLDAFLRSNGIPEDAGVLSKNDIVRIKTLQ